VPQRPRATRSRNNTDACASECGPTAAIPTLPKSLLEKVDEHISRLHDELGITAADEPLWRQYVQVMHDNAAQMEQALVTRGTDAVSMNATENMQFSAQLAQLHATDMQKLESAFQSLYNSSPCSQKKNADSVFLNERRKALPSKS
jgi:periplasmic protein CpxP/Spy